MHSEKKSKFWPYSQNPDFAIGIPTKFILEILNLEKKKLNLRSKSEFREKSRNSEINVGIQKINQNSEIKLDIPSKMPEFWYKVVIPKKNSNSENKSLNS